MIDKKTKRLRRSQRGRHTIRRLNAVRLSVHRTLQHTYAQVISSNGEAIIASASTLDKEIKGSITNGSNIVAAKAVGQLVAKRALEKGVKRIAFDRAGFKYHGRIKALAEGAREGGLEF